MRLSYDMYICSILTHCRAHVMLYGAYNINKANNAQVDANVGCIDLEKHHAVTSYRKQRTLGACVEVSL